jgi:hypothetical protein
MEREIIKGATEGFEYTRYSIQNGECLKVYDNKNNSSHLFFSGIVEVETKGVSVRSVRQFAVLGNKLEQMLYTTISDDFTITEEVL